MAWRFDPDELRSDLELALGWLEGDDPTSGDLEIVGRLHRWLEEPEPAREYFLRAAADVERYLNGRGAGTYESMGRQGGFLYLAGDESWREWCERARAAADEVVNRAVVVGLSYLLGDDETALRVTRSEKDEGALLAKARHAGDPKRVDAAIKLFVRKIRADQLPIRADRLDFHLSDYDWLEECFRLKAELAGEPVPEHRTMLERAGLAKAAERRPQPPEPELPMGRWEIGEAALVVPADGVVKATLDRQRRLVLEIQGEPPQYAVALYEDDAMLAGVSPVAGYSDAAVDMLRAHAPEAEPVFRALLAAAAAGDWPTVQ